MAQCPPPPQYATGSADISVLSQIIDCMKTLFSIICTGFLREHKIMDLFINAGWLLAKLDPMYENGQLVCRRKV